ncbi:SDR family oxidoreductase [Agrobacterium pusense]|uniref:SDR family oxidoreductase n=1 Tax=Agrobacterium pusense TaxID=648995 RepID=UPI001C6DFCF2|nr:NAD(P)H-binding protein [Agrobacterium pusense]MBW9070200.1 NAD(P)H-binding protein [Agrobacterium pusense]MBW9084960.1 NAD(P)H-binding protein [Agrobacterium pusense]MBW9125565.1 NAD(P)H-binding protein [Agrobacterium pusense]MBW9137980.1 NAD(P)H-binding protein [Agrobacterium pusense]
MTKMQKVVVIGGTGLIGSKAVKLLQDGGHEAIAASSRNGINAYTGEGLAEALAGADAVIDVSNMMSFDKQALVDFFGASSRNLTSAEQDAGTRHHVALSIVNADQLKANPYMEGKLAQEETVAASGQAYTIVRATQFHEFIETLAGAYAADGVVKVPDIDFQPIAAADVAAALVEVALGAPKNGTVDLAGPERASFESFIRTYLTSKADSRLVAADDAVDYFGAPVVTGSLVPGGDYVKGRITIAEWLRA